MRVGSGSPVTRRTLPVAGDGADAFVVAGADEAVGFSVSVASIISAFGFGEVFFAGGAAFGVSDLAGAAAGAVEPAAT
jgi:hypothetical protein